MALRYFDRNGATAGFGTLTGAWDTTTASWSTSSAGTATPAAFTFTNADEAQFGATGVTATAGTATISTGVTVTLNKVTTQNIGTQTVAAAGTGKLVLAGTNPALNTDAGTGLLITGPLEAASGFRKTGTGVATSQGTNTLDGTLEVDAGAIVFGALGSGSVNLSGIDAVNVNHTVGYALGFQAANAYTYAGTFAMTVAVTGNGSGVSSMNAGGVTLQDTTSVSNFTGFFRVEAQDTAGAEGRFILPTIPTSAFRLAFVTQTSGATARTTSIAIEGSSGTVSVPVVLQATQASTGAIHALEDNASGARTYSGGASLRSDSNASATQTFRLQGTNTDTTLSGAIVQDAGRGIMALSKSGTGKWALTGANTHTGTNTIAQGTLSAQSSSALGPDSTGSGGAVSITGGTLELAGGITLDKSGLNISSVTTAGPTNAFQVPASGGNNTIECGSITLNSTIRVEVGTGGALRLANTGAISGLTFGITKEGAGELDLNAAANTFTGAVAVNAGTLTVADSCAPSSNGPLGNATSDVTVAGTLRYDGAGNSNISRSVQLTGASPALDASGGGHIHFSAVTQSAIASRTVTLKGTSTSGNQLQSALGDASGGVTALTKEGASKWTLTGAPTYTGLTTISAGTLDLGSQNVALSGGVAIAAGLLANGTAGNTLTTAVTFTGGTVQAVLASTSAVTASSGTGRLNPTVADGSNTYSGTTTVQSGATLELVTAANPATSGNGKVTGAGNVTVSGTLSTGSGVVQRGQARYGGNLTFASGSTLRIGAAA